MRGGRLDVNQAEQITLYRLRTHKVETIDGPVGWRAWLSREFARLDAGGDWARLRVERGPRGRGFALFGLYVGELIEEEVERCIG
jgi:hypothetical protein